jgi:hypothetical protein
MTYTPTTAFQVAILREVGSTAIALHAGTRDSSYLLTGAPQPMAIRLNGDMEGSAFDLVNAGNGEGMVFKDISLEVDVSSSFRPALVEQPLGAFVIATARSGSGFNDARTHPIGEATPRPSNAPELGFTKWRAVQMRGGERFEIFAYEATKLGDF